MNHLGSKESLKKRQFIWRKEPEPSKIFQEKKINVKSPVPDEINNDDIAVMSKTIDIINKKLNQLFEQNVTISQQYSEIKTMVQQLQDEKRNTEGNTKTFIPYYGSKDLICRDNYTHLNGNNLEISIEIVGLPKEEELIVYPFSDVKNVGSFEEMIVPLTSGDISIHGTFKKLGDIYVIILNDVYTQGNKISLLDCTFPMTLKYQGTLLYS